MENNLQLIKFGNTCIKFGNKSIGNCFTMTVKWYMFVT